MKKYLFIILLLLPFLATAQEQSFEDKGDKAYAAGDYREAEIQFKAALAKMDYSKVDKNSGEYLKLERKLNRVIACLPLLETAESLMNSAKANPSEESYGKAKKAYQAILQKNSTDRSAKQNVILCDSRINALIRGREDNAMWDRVKKENTKGAYEQYLAEFADGLHAGEAANLILTIEEEELWAKASSLNTENAYHEYIANTKTSDHLSEAQYAISISRDNAKWAALADGTNEAGLLAYIADTTNISKQYLEKANAYLAVFRAKRYSASTAADSRKIVQELSTAQKEVGLDLEAQKILERNKAIVDYEDFMKNPTIADGEKYLSRYDQSVSAHRGKVGNTVAKLYADSFRQPKTKSEMTKLTSEYNKAMKYVTENETRTYVKNRFQTLEKQYKKRVKEIAWSDRWQIGIGVDGEMDFADNLAYGPTVEFKIGSSDDLFNFSLGAKYLLWNSKKMGEDFVEDYTPIIGVNQLPVFAAMKFNFNSFYLALQASYNFNVSSTFKAPYMNDYWDEAEEYIYAYQDGEVIKDPSIVFKNNITAGLRIGMNIAEQWDLGVYAKYDITPTFDVNYLSSSLNYNYQDGTAYSKSVNSRLRFGVNLIYYIVL